MLTPPDIAGAHRLRGFEPDIQIVTPLVDDVWMRHIAPVFVKRAATTLSPSTSTSVPEMARACRGRPTVWRESPTSLCP